MSGQTSNSIIMIRNSNLDGLKFLMMLLVVLGHLGYEDYGIGVTKVIYSFHMPVFVFLSGYFTSITNKEKFFNRLRTFLLIYFIAQSTQYIFNVVCGKIIQNR